MVIENKRKSIPTRNKSSKTILNYTSNDHKSISHKDTEKQTDNARYAFGLKFAFVFLESD